MIWDISAILFLVGLYIFAMGYHNVDVAVNLMNQGVMTDGTFAGTWLNADIYRSGLQEILISVALMMLSLIILLLNSGHNEHRYAKHSKRH